MLHALAFANMMVSVSSSQAQVWPTSPTNATTCRRPSASGQPPTEPNPCLRLRLRERDLRPPIRTPSLPVVAVGTRNEDSQLATSIVVSVQCYMNPQKSGLSQAIVSQLIHQHTPYSRSKNRLNIDTGADVRPVL